MRLIHFRPRKRHRKNPRRRSRARSRRVRRNPARRVSRRRYRRNPVNLRGILSPSNFMQIGAVTVGFVGGAKIGGMIYDKAFASGPLAAFRRFAGLVTFALGAFAAGKVKNPLAQKAAAGISAAGVYDLIAQNLPAAGLKPVSGDTISMRGVDLVGENGDRVYAGDTIDVSGDMTELVGDESDSVYAA